MSDKQAPDSGGGKVEGEKPGLSKRLKLKLPSQLSPDDPILVIQEQQDLRLIMIHHLKKMNFNKVEHAGNGYDAIEHLRKSETGFKMIVCDMTMPIMGGVDFLNEIQESPEFRRPPFCMTIGDPSKEKIMHAVEAGVDEVLVKPFTLGDLKPKLRKAFSVYYNPKNPEPVYELAKGFLRNGDLEKAKTIYKLIRDDVKAVARPLVGLARIALQEGNFEEATKLVDEAAERNPHFVFAFELKGQILAKQEKWSEAIEQLKKAIDLSPLNPMRYRTAAELFFKVERYRDAIELLTKGVNHGIEFTELYHFLSQAYYAIEEYSDALKYIRSAISRSPDNVTYLNQQGVCYRNLEQYDEALKVYNQIIKIEPENQVALYNKAVMFHSKKDVDGAVKLLKKICTRFPDFREARTKLEKYEQELRSAAKEQKAAS